MELASQKLMAEIKSLRDEMKNLRDDVSSINRQLRSIPSSPPSRGDYQVSPPTHVAPSGQGQGFGHEGYNQNYPPQQQQGFQPRQVHIDENQGGFTGAAVAETTRGRGTNLPSNLTMDKVFYCGGKR
ncbi:MAG: hypothetical protein ABIJ21_02870 [Nanoarchaeota archaeon]